MIYHNVFTFNGRYLKLSKIQEKIKSADLSNVCGCSGRCWERSSRGPKHKNPHEFGHGQVYITAFHQSGTVWILPLVGKTQTASTSWMEKRGECRKTWTAFSVIHNSLHCTGKRQESVELKKLWRLWSLLFLQWKSSTPKGLTKPLRSDI